MQYDIGLLLLIIPKLLLARPVDNITEILLSNIHLVKSH